MFVSGGYFPALGLKPAIGRLIGPEDDKDGGEANVVVLGYDYWQNYFGGDPDIVDKSMTVAGQLMTIVGVAPHGFSGTTLGVPARIFVPIALNSVEARTYYWLYIFGRLRPGVTREQAAVAINAQYRNILHEYDVPATAKVTGADSPIMEQFRTKMLTLKPGSRGQSTVSESNRKILTTRMVSALLLLIIACANVTNLFVARGIARAGEIALRSSLGATRGQIIRQLLTESFIFVIIAGAAGILAGHWILRFLVSMYPPRIAALFSLSMNETALLFAVLLTFATGIITGLFPAIHSTRSDVTPLLKEQAGQTTGSKSAARVRTALIIAQIALSLTMLVVSGFFAKNIYALNNTDLGMKIDNIVTFSVSPSQNGYSPQQVTQFFERMEEELAVIPGVAGVTSSRNPMLRGSSSDTNVNAEGAISELGQNTRVDMVGANYMRTFSIPLVSGRDFTSEDIYGTGQKTVIVNEAFVELFNLGRDAVGKHVAAPYNGNLDYQIVGIAKNARNIHVMVQPQPFIFFPHTKYGSSGYMIFYVKTALPVNSVIPQIRDLVSRMDPTLPIQDLTTMTQTMRESTFSARFQFTLAIAGASIASLLTAVGLYGIFAYNVKLRRREIGLRAALGATRVKLCFMFLRNAALITVTGCLISLALSIFAGRQIASMLYKFEGFDKGVFFGAAVLLFIIMMLAVLIPVRRAVMTEPSESMRDE
jgi:predicted permease